MFSSPPQVYSRLCVHLMCWNLAHRQRWVKSTIKSNIELDITNCHVSMTSCSNSVNKPKIRAFSDFVLIVVQLC